MRRNLKSTDFVDVHAIDRTTRLTSDDERIEAMQLERLASTVLSKTPADLAALVEANPLIVWEWIEAFRQQKIEADRRARFWSAAIASLATARPEVVRGAAE